MSKALYKTSTEKLSPDARPSSAFKSPRVSTSTVYSRTRSVAPTEQSRLFALIIGINTYESDEFRNLRGGVADAESFKQYLEVDLKVPRSQITFLTEKDASRSAILSGFKSLQNDSRIQRGDPIFIFYAGHGGELKPPEGWDTGARKIQVLVPHDYSTERKIPGITDREVRKLLDEISKEKGDNITVVFDCCHAASGRRGDEDQSPSLVRSAAEELDCSIYSDVFEGEERAAQFSPETAHIGLNSHVLVTACSLTEYAKESNGRGNLSTAFLTLLRTTGPDNLRYSDILKHMDLIPNQNPRCEGMNQNRFIFNKMVLPRQRAAFPVRYANNGTFILLAGTAHGINVGAEFTIYASKDVALENPMGVLVVDSENLESYSATMKVPPGAPNLSLPQPAVAMQTQAGQRPDLRLYIHPDPNHYLSSLVREIRHHFPNVTIVNQAEDAQISIEMVNTRVTLRIIEQKLVRYNFTRQIDGIEPTLEELSYVLKAAAHYFWHLNCIGDNPEVANSIQVELYKLREDELSEDLIPVGDNLCVDNEIDFVVEEGEPYGLKIINKHPSHDVFLSVFYFDNSDLSIESYYQHPAPGAATDIAEPPLPANGGNLTIGDDLGGSDPFFFYLLEGEDIDIGFMKIFLVSQPVDLSDVAQEAPFESFHRQTMWKKPVEPIWGTVTIPLIQRRYPLTRQRPAVDPNTLAIVPRREGLPPSSNIDLPDLTDSVTLDGSRFDPIGRGGYADVHLATLSANGVMEKVAIKVIRSHVYSEENKWKIEKRLKREIYIWASLRHPNVVPLLGTMSNFGSYTAMVCPWMSEGDLCRYLDERKTELNLGRRLQILSEVAEGLAYLHSRQIIHGDLTTANILMHEGRAHLHDFGLSNTKAETRNSSFMTSKAGGAVRWAAPELFPFDEDTTPELAMHCDIYSFGAVALHVISGRILYEDLSDFQILMQLTRPESRASGPPRPQEPLLTDECWDFICCCLTRDYLARPDVNELRKLLKMLRSGSSTETLAANVSFDRDESLHTPIDEFNRTEIPRYSSTHLV